MTEVALALGSNLGDRLGSLRLAVDHLQSMGWRLIKASPVFETPPFGHLEQPRFLNACVIMETPSEDLTELLRAAKNVEAKMGRLRRFKNGPREIDIDILFAGQTVFSSEELTVPHVGIPERAFVLLPLSTIAPSWVHPKLGLSVREMLQRVSTEGIVEITHL